MCVKFNLPPFCLLLEGIEIHCFIRLHSEFPLVHLPFSMSFCSLQVATLIAPWPSLSSSQAVEEVPPDICQGFVRSKVTRGHPVEASKDGKVLLGRSCHVLLLGANYWSFFFHAVSWKNHWGWRFQDPQKNGHFSRKLLYTLIFERQKTQRAHTHTHIMTSISISHSSDLSVS